MRQRFLVNVPTTFILLCSGLFSTGRTPRFEEYAAMGIYRGKNAPLVLTKNDRAYRTRLRRAATKGPNFAAHYILTAWGCGTECLVSVVIDANTGRVYWAPHTICCWGPEVPPEFQRVEAHLNSRLIVFRGERDEREGDNAAHYYEFVGGTFVYLTSEKVSARQGR
jgi:hypothetical protein